MFARPLSFQLEGHDIQVVLPPYFSAPWRPTCAIAKETRSSRDPGKSLQRDAWRACQTVNSSDMCGENQVSEDFEISGLRRRRRDPRPPGGASRSYHRCIFGGG